MDINQRTRIIGNVAVGKTADFEPYLDGHLVQGWLRSGTSVTVALEVGSGAEWTLVKEATIIGEDWADIGYAEPGDDLRVRVRYLSGDGMIQCRARGGRNVTYDKTLSGGIELTAGGGVIYETPTRFASAHRIHTSPPFAAGTNNVTIANQHPVPAGATGLRAIYENGTATASTLGGMKIATGNTDGDNGAALTWTAATCVGASTVALPIAVGTSPQSVITQVLSDLYTPPAGFGTYAYFRSYFAGSGCALNPGAGELTAFAAETGQIYKSGFAGGIIADTTGIALTAGQLICPSGAIWTFDVPSYTLAAFGGSTLAAYAAEANTYGMVFKAAALLSTAYLKVSPYVAAQSGQNSITSMNQISTTIPLILPRFALILLGSGNDGDLSAAGFSAMRARVVADVEVCRKYGTTPILVTLMPASDLTAPQEVLRVAQNAWGMALPGIVKADISTACSDPANVAQLLPAFNSGDGKHLNPAGQTVASGVIAAAVALASER